MPGFPGAGPQGQPMVMGGFQMPHGMPMPIPPQMRPGGGQATPQGQATLNPAPPPNQPQQNVNGNNATQKLVGRTVSEFNSNSKLSTFPLTEPDK